jgi:hypothetical protein
MPSLFSRNRLCPRDALRFWRSLEPGRRVPRHQRRFAISAVRPPPAPQRAPACPGSWIAAPFSMSVTPGLPRLHHAGDRRGSCVSRIVVPARRYGLERHRRGSVRTASVIDSSSTRTARYRPRSSNCSRSAHRRGKFSEWYCQSRRDGSSGVLASRSERLNSSVPARPGSAICARRGARSRNDVVLTHRSQGSTGRCRNAGS